jgi:hypothetical protein
MLNQIFKNRKQILEGIENNIFKKEHVEEIAFQRLLICTECKHYDIKGEGCLVPGTAPCCNKNNGGCGCSLSLKTRSLSSSCPLEQPKWEAVLTEKEENVLNKQL